MTPETLLPVTKANWTSRILPALVVLSASMVLAACLDTGAPGGRIAASSDIPADSDDIAALSAGSAQQNAQDTQEVGTIAAAGPVTQTDATSTLVTGAASIRPEERYRFGYEGLGPLVLGTRWRDRDTLQKAFAPLKMVSAWQSTESGVFPVLRFLDGDEEVFRARFSADGVLHDGVEAKTNTYRNLRYKGGRVNAIISSSARVRGVQGERIGQTLDKLYSHTQALERCAPATEELSGSIYCRATDQFGIFFRGSHSGADDQMPPYRILRKWKVTQFQHAGDA